MTGSIPACAGKPFGSASQGRRLRVHPRVCGEARIDSWRGRLIDGPSPRVRGSPSPDGSGAHAVGSIPACAGKPSIPRSITSRRRVHPRVCGEAST